MRTLPALLASSALLVAGANAQTPVRTDSTRRDPTNTLPLVTSRTVRFTTDQGTWMSVDVSPDGSTIVFDHLGDLYTVPIAGGRATRIVGGNSIDVQPRYAPDGKSIVFTSDRNGVDGTWLSDADGKRPRLLTPGGHYPAFTPDGQQIITGNRLVDIRGGTGVVLPGFGTAPSFTADGRYVWFQNGTQAGRFDRQRGTVSYRTNLPGGVLRPMVSADGEQLAYFTRFEGQSALVVRDLASGADKWVLMRTQPEAGVPLPPPFVAGPPGPAPGGGRGATPPAATGVGPLPTSAWLPNGNTIITSFGGKLWRVEIATGRKAQIPFSVDVEQSLGALAKGAMNIGDSVRVRQVREPALSPDGRRLVFTALGKVYVVDVAGGTPRRVTTGNAAVESSPTFAPNSQSVVYATWVDGDGGDIFQVDLNGGAPRNLTRAPALYARMNYTPDGSRLVFARAPRRARTVAVDDAGVQLRTAAGTGSELNVELRWMTATGGTQTPITVVADVGLLPQGGYAHFTADTSRVFFHEAAGLVSVLWDGSDRKVVLAGAAPHTRLSPDGVRVLSRAGRRGHIYLFELPQVSDSLTIDPSIAATVVPVRRLTRADGDFPTWSRDGRTAVWSTGSAIFVYDIAKGDKATADSVEAAGSRSAAPSDTARRTGGAADSTTRWAPAYEATRYDVRIAVAVDKPVGIVALRGARIISMKSKEVIENGDVVITGDRITAVGARGSVTIPAGARTINVAGKTIVPGYVDVHAQIAAPSQIHRTLVPQYLANLAFGVTTTRDPESPSHDLFTYADRIATADLLGPRVFATGPVALDSALTVRTLAEGRTFITPYANSYTPGSIRADLNATRADRQRFLMVSKELGLTTVAMGTPDFKKSLSAIVDGFADHQAAYEIFPLHDDVARLIAESGLTYTPMLLGRVGSRNGIEHILATERPHDDAKLQRYYYHKDLDRLLRARGTWNVAEEYPFDDVAYGAARIVAAGGKVALGSNGRVQGLGLHWEMWLLAKGGMSNHDILRAATTVGADAIGVGAQLGTIEPGKLADLQVLDRNPLTDIRNTNSLRYVMKNGRLYDAFTLDQLTPTAKKMDPLWWAGLEPYVGNR